ncbi:hypothetical protein WA158_001374 [Blastocystis sp. Blastoise]
MSKELNKEYLTSQAKEYISWEPDEACRNEISQIVAAENWEELDKRFGKRIAFGTAGLRQAMEAGYSRMNHLVVLQTAQGLLRYLDDTYGEEGKSRGVVIGYDHRCNGTLSSRSFASISALVFMSQGYKVFLSREVCATPMVPYIVDEVEAVLGIMVTASHNPKKDDGYKLCLYFYYILLYIVMFIFLLYSYKVYWENGAQIIPPHDRNIANYIMHNLEPWEEYRYLDVDRIFDSPLCIDNFSYMTNSYFETLKNAIDFKVGNQEIVPVVYTAMHGVGGLYVHRLTDLFNLPPFIYVPSQCDPDPEFPTVSFPNPEEKGALSVAENYADSINVGIVIATDPDADRFTCAEKRDGAWYQFTGDQIGAMLGYLLLLDLKQSGCNDMSKYCYIASTVSSKLLKRIAEVEGLHFEECLTGFKWIGNTNIKCHQEGFIQLLGYEEAIGYALGENKKDKDGISICIYLYQKLIQLYSDGLTLFDLLQEIYTKYGYYLTNNSYVITPSSDYTEAVFKRLRNNGQYCFKCGHFIVNSIRDLTLGYDSNTQDGKPTLYVDPNAHMITYTFKEGPVVTIRTSGTEPKIKYYMECHGTTKEEAQNLLDDFSSEFLKNMLTL